MKHIIVLVVALFTVLVVGTGCSSIFTPSNMGNATGRAVYLGYVKVAEGKDKAFTEKVNALWTEVNKLETIDDLVSSADKLSTSFDSVIESKELSDGDRESLKALKAMVIDKVKEVMNSTFTSNTEAIDFLVGVRAGVNAMIK